MSPSKKRYLDKFWATHPHLVKLIKERREKQARRKAHFEGRIGPGGEIKPRIKIKQKYAQA